MAVALLQDYCVNELKVHYLTMLGLSRLCSLFYVKTFCTNSTGTPDCAWSDINIEKLI